MNAYYAYFLMNIRMRQPYHGYPIFVALNNFDIALALQLLERNLEVLQKFPEKQPYKVMEGFGSARKTILYLAVLSYVHCLKHNEQNLPQLLKFIQKVVESYPEMMTVCFLNSQAKAPWQLAFSYYLCNGSIEKLEILEVLAPHIPHASSSKGQLESILHQIAANGQNMAEAYFFKVVACTVALQVDPEQKTLCSQEKARDIAIKKCPDYLSVFDAGVKEGQTIKKHNEMVYYQTISYLFEAILGISVEYITQYVMKFLKPTFPSKLNTTGVAVLKALASQVWQLKQLQNKVLASVSITSTPLSEQIKHIEKINNKEDTLLKTLDEKEATDVDQKTQDMSQILQLSQLQDDKGIIANTQELLLINKIQYDNPILNDVQFSTLVSLTKTLCGKEGIRQLIEIGNDPVMYINFEIARQKLGDAMAIAQLICGAQNIKEEIIDGISAQEDTVKQAVITTVNQAKTVVFNQGLIAPELLAQAEHYVNTGEVFQTLRTSMHNELVRISTIAPNNMLCEEVMEASVAPPYDSLENFIHSTASYPFGHIVDILSISYQS